MSNRAAIFDLDGVLVDSARLHFLSWKRIADELGIAFDEHDNLALKGVDRMGSLALILANSTKVFSPLEREDIAARKNGYYLEAVAAMGPGDLLPGAEQLVLGARAAGLACALASASRNAQRVLDRVGLSNAFDFIADPARLAPKPSPDLFLAGAAALGIAPGACIGFEDSAAGILAIRAAGMLAIGIGDANELRMAHRVFPSTADINLEVVLDLQV